MKFSIFLLLRLGVTNSLLAATPTAGERPLMTNPPAPAGFKVDGYEISGNTILTYEQLEPIFTNYVGRAVTIDHIRKALSELQLAYRELGFVSVSVALPRQQLTNGLVKVQVTEGRLNEISVTGNRYFSSNNVRRALPSLTTNVMLNTRWFQPELDIANRNRDRQIYPVISPGSEPGTSALTLKVKDRMPLHGHVRLDNRATPDTPPLRIDTTVQYNNFWQLEHQAGLNYNFSPEQKSDSQMPRFWDQPEIANYAGFYRIPFGNRTGLRETYAKMPSDFGFDPVTRSVRLPPPTGNPELIITASRSYTEAPTRLGPISTVTNTVLADISRQSADRELSTIENVGARITVPLSAWQKIESAVNFGIDLKHFDHRSFNTNLTYFDLYSLDDFGNRVLVRKDVIPLDSFSRNTITYIPLSYGWSGSQVDRLGSTALTVGQTVYLSALSSGDSGIQEAARSRKAGGNFTRLNFSLVREQQLPGDWSLGLKANGQWSSAPLVTLEQFGLGGTTGVRGYEEGEEYGDTGWRVLVDLRTAPIGLGELPNGNNPVPVHLRPSWFLDFGQRFLLDASPGQRGTESMAGTGLSAYATAGEHFDARLTLGWGALFNTTRTRAGQARGYFSISYKF